MSYNKIQFVVVQLLFVDYEQSLFFLSLSNKTRENAARRSLTRAAALVSRVSRLRRSTIPHARE